MARQKSTEKTIEKTTEKKPSTPRAANQKKGVPTVKRSKAAVKSATVSSEYTPEASMLDEVLTILIILVSIVAFLSLCTDKMGFVGTFINSLLKGLFGFGGLLLPIFSVIYCIWILFSKQKRFKTVRLLCAFVILLCAGALVHAFNTPFVNAGISFFDKCLLFYKNGSLLNGGLLGGLLGGTLKSGFNTFLTVLILLVFILIGIIGATGKSFFRFVGNVHSFNKRKRREKEKKIISKAETVKERQQVREEKEQKKLERKHARGSFDFKLEKPKNTADLKEVPLIDIPVFGSYSEKQLVKSTGSIYDYSKEPYWEESLDTQGAPSAQPLEVEKELAQNQNGRQIINELHQLDSVESNSTLQTPDTVPEEPAPFLEEASPAQEPVPVENPSVLYEQAHQQDHQKEAETPPYIPQPDYSAPPLAKVPEAQPITLNKTEPQASSTTNMQSPVAQQPSSTPPTASPEKPQADTQYAFPPIDLLGKDTKMQTTGSKTEMITTAKKLEETLKSFGVDAKVLQINRGPTVTRYELSPSQGVKVSKIVNLADDIALNLAATGIRIEAPIPGKAAVGIEVPNKEAQSVYLRTVLDTEEFLKFPSKLAFALGEDIAGNTIVADIGKMPHLLIAGATGSGKSVCINTLITSILYKAKPDEVKLLMIDPKVVELSVYNGIPHLLIPVVTDPKKASGALNWAVREMLQRYNDFAENNVRDIKGFNAAKKERNETDLMPQIVIIIDELADLMMAAPGEVEDAICRLAQMARAAGIHLIIATQRPSVDVITGVIKANIPSRLAFAVSSGTDSRTILDSTGAEKLLGKGDMLFYPVGMSKPLRVQGAFVTDKEVESIVNFLKAFGTTEYDTEMIEKITIPSKTAGADEESDEFFESAVDLVVKKEKASVSMLQRQFRIGYNRAARLMDNLEARGIVGPEDGSKPRQVLISNEELEEMKEQGTL